MGAGHSIDVPESLEHIDPENLSAGDVRCISAAITNDAPGAQDAVMSYLVKLASSDDTKEKVVQPDTLALLCLLASSSALHIQKRAAATFAHLAVNDDLRHRMVKGQCLKPILSLARVRDDELRIWAVWTLASLAETDENKQPMVQSGVLPVLYDLSQLADPRIKGYVAATLANLAKRDEIKQSIVTTGGIGVVIELAAVPESRVQSYAGAAIANLSSKDEWKQAVVDAGGLATVAALGRSSDHGVQCFAAAACANFSKSQQYHVAIIEEIGLTLLNNMLQSNNSETMCFAAATLANLAKNDIVRNLMESSVPVLVSIANGTNVKAKRYATAALAHLAKSDRLCSFIQDLGGDSLIQLLKRPSQRERPGSASMMHSFLNASSDGLAKVLLETQRSLELKNQELIKVTTMYAQTHKELQLYQQRHVTSSPTDHTSDVSSDDGAQQQALSVAEHEDLKARLTQVLKEKDRVLQQCEAAYKEIKTLQMQIASLEKERDTLKRALSETQANSLESEGLLQDSEQRVAQLQTQLSELQLQVSTTSAEKQTSTKLLDVIADKDSQLAEAQKSIAYLKSKVELAEKKAAASEQQAKALDQQKQVLGSDYEEQKQQALAALEAQMKTQIAKAEAQKQIALDEVQITKQALQKAQAESSARAEEMQQELKDRVSSLEQQQKSLEEQLLAEQNKNATLAAELTALNSQQTFTAAAFEDLTRKYREEMTKRKQLFNKLQELQGNIRVYCRVRPLSTKEEEEGLKSAVSFPEQDHLSVYDVDKLSSKLFDFEKVYTTDARQDGVFTDVEPLITSVLDGYHVCIFAYGQTGSGKTYTMEGPPGDPLADPGVNIRALQELFRLKQERAEAFDIDIKMTMVEIYNETIKDLLDTKERGKKLELKQRPSGSGVYLPDVTAIEVDSPEAIQQLMELGRKNRATGVTKANEHSSRSHCILGIEVVSSNRLLKTKFMGKLNLVDLAGSERFNVSGVTGDAQVEAISINKSLSALGDVIYALGNKRDHIPYRNSKLTHMLQESLTAESKALMVVQVSPNPRHVQETLCSLNFASRVRAVELGAAKQMKTDGPPRLKSSQSARRK